MHHCDKQKFISSGINFFLFEHRWSLLSHFRSVLGNLILIDLHILYSLNIILKQLNSLFSIIFLVVVLNLMVLMDKMNLFKENFTKDGSRRMSLCCSCKHASICLSWISWRTMPGPPLWKLYFLMNSLLKFQRFWTKNRPFILRGLMFKLENGWVGQNQS